LSTPCPSVRSHSRSCMRQDLGYGRSLWFTSAEDKLSVRFQAKPPVRRMSRGGFSSIRMSRSSIRLAKRNQCCVFHAQNNRPALIPAGGKLGVTSQRCRFGRHRKATPFGFWSPCASFHLQSIGQVNLMRSLRSGPCLRRTNHPLKRGEFAERPGLNTRAYPRPIASLPTGANDSVGATRKSPFFHQNRPFWTR